MGLSVCCAEHVGSSSSISMGLSVCCGKEIGNSSSVIMGLPVCCAEQKGSNGECKCRPVCRAQLSLPHVMQLARHALWGPDKLHTGTLELGHE